jgi:hypothetical protein
MFRPFRAMLPPNRLFEPDRSDPQLHGILFGGKARFVTPNMNARADESNRYGEL